MKQVEKAGRTVPASRCGATVFLAALLFAACLPRPAAAAAAPAAAPDPAAALALTDANQDAVANALTAVYVAGPLSGTEAQGLRRLREGFRDAYHRFLPVTAVYAPDAPVIVFGKRAALAAGLASADELEAPGACVLRRCGAAIMVAGATDDATGLAADLLLAALARRATVSPGGVTLAAPAWTSAYRTRYGGATFTIPTREAVGVYVLSNRFTHAGRTPVMEGRFRLAGKPPAHPVLLTLEGVDCDHPVAPAEIRVALNDMVVHEGPLHFSKRCWTRQSFAVPAGALRSGDNLLRVVNICDPASITNWFERWVLFTGAEIQFADFSHQAREAAAPPGLAPGATIVFMGDSITHQCLYTRYLRLFYATRYPHIPIRVYNGGVGGNVVSSAFKRFACDIAEPGPAIVAVLFGMNDAAYQPFDEKRLAAYRGQTTQLADRIRAETSAEPLLLTPTFYDKPEEAPTEGYNATLVRFGDALREIGREKRVPVIDLNAPMAAAAAALRRIDPASRLADPIHPDKRGHFVMVYAFLKGVGVRGTVSSVVLDVTTGAARTEACLLARVRLAEDAAAFDLLAHALPFPYPEDVRAVLGVVPFTEELNREWVQVAGLREGLYELRIDDEPVGAYRAEDLARGIHLADTAATPQHRQARTALALGDRIADAVHERRDFRLKEMRKGLLQADGTYRTTMQKLVKDDAGKTKWVTDEEAEAAFAREAGGQERLLREIAAMEDELYGLCQPQWRHYSLTRLGDAAP